MTSPNADWQPTLTGRLLTLRPLLPDDFDALFAVGSDPLIWEQHPDNNRYEPDVFRAFFDGAIASRAAFAVVDNTTGTIIGSSRYHGYDAGRSEVEIGWTFLARSHWGGRYNGEMKWLMLKHAFRFVDRVVFHVGTTNWRSQRAVERIGGVRTGISANSAGRPSVVFEMTRAGFQTSPLRSIDE